MSENFSTEIRDRILIVRLTRPAKKNALTRDMYEGLAAAISRLDGDSELRVLLLTGSEDSFTAGNDINDFLQYPPHAEGSPVNAFLAALPGIEKPFVVAVNGVAVGIGTTMLLHADLVYAAESARFRMPFVDLALVPEAGSSYLLPRLLGRAKASELLLLAREFDAAEAESLGIVNRVVPDDALFEAALEAAQEIARKPPQAVRLTKKLLRGHQEPLLAAMEKEGEIILERIRSDEAREVFTAFMEKRPPKFD